MQRDEYENKLRALGCEMIGNGYFSNVFNIPQQPDKVIKVGPADDQWPLYARWATENGHSGKFAPMIHSLKFYDGFYAAIMERLVCTVGDIRNNNCYRGGKGTELQAIFNEVTGREEKTEACDLAAYVNELRALGHSNDFHDGNVMVRKDGQLVITDPFSFGTSGRFRIKLGACL